MFVTLIAAASAAPSMTQEIVSTATYPDATCNDGSSPMYFIHEGSGANADRWVIFLEGGSSCHDDASCSTRMNSPQKMGSGCDDSTCGQDIGALSLPGRVHSTGPNGGIFDDIATNDFRDWTLVYVDYCSSDTFSGDGGSLSVAGFPNIDGSSNVEFNGHNVLHAVSETLKNRAGHNLQSADEVLFGGGSAGSAAARHNIDRFGNWLDDFNPNAELRGLFDAAFVGKVDPTSGAAFLAGTGDCESTLSAGSFDPTAPPSTSATSRYNAWQAKLDKSCENASTDPESCFDLSYLVDGDYIDTPFFVVQSQRDSMALENRIGSHVPSLSLSQQRECLSDLTMSFGPAAYAAEAEMDGWFIPCSVALNTDVHVHAPGDLFYTDTISGVSLHDALSDWVSGSTARYTDTCP